MRDELLKLAERVEALTGPDRETDEAIGFALGWGKVGTWWLRPGDDPNDVSAPDLPHFTASLDAAMGLVPPQASYVQFEWCGRTDGGGRCEAEVSWLDGPTIDAPEVRGLCWSAATPALALTAAALRARAEGVA